MGVAGSINPTGGAPKPDPARVAAIRYTIVDEAETCANFGEAARANLASLNDRALAETRSGDLGECVLLLDHVRDRLAVLDPARLAPRKGLAGLFDSRSKRLKTFRLAYASAASAVGQSASDISDRAGALTRKGKALETLWVEARDAIADLDAHIVAARGWLANETPAPEAVLVPDPATPSIEARDAQEDAEVETDAPAAEVAETPALIETVAETTRAAPTPEVEPDTAETVAEAVAETPPGPAPLESASATVVALSHPLATRLAALEAVRATAISRLPLLRAAQNADWRTPAALKQVCDGVEAWRADWQDALGLTGKRPKNVSPDRIRLSGASTALIDRIEVAGREVSAAQGRRAELDARIEPPRVATRMAA